MMVDIKSVYHIFVTKKNYALMKWAQKRILNADNFSHGIRYRINTEKMEIEQIWQYGKERGTSSSLRIFVM